jgi:spheroidene monooxygenase
MGAAGLPGAAAARPAARVAGRAGDGPAPVVGRRDEGPAPGSLAAGEARAEAARPVDAFSDDVAVVLLAHLAPRHRPWGWWRVVRGGGVFRGTPGLVFAKVLGSGHEGGFGLRPSASRQGLFAVLEDESAARRFLAQSALVAAWQGRCVEACTMLLRATSSRGSWSGHRIGVGAAAPPAGEPIVSLTRASIRPGRAAAFWKMSPAAEASLAAAAGCRLAVGLGEAPLLRQATLSVWRDAASMEAYARRGAHLDAIRAAREGGHFAESMFVRFVPISIRGRWHDTGFDG